MRNTGVSALSEKEVSAIRKILDRQISNNEIAKKFKVSPSVISSIKHNKSYYKKPKQ